MATSSALMPDFRARVAERLPILGNLTTVELRRLVSAASVPDEFLEGIAGTIDNSPVVGVANEIRRGTPRRDRVQPGALHVGGRLEQLARDVRSVVLKVRHDVGQRALGVYGTGEEHQPLEPEAARLQHRRAEPRARTHPPQGKAGEDAAG